MLVNLDRAYKMMDQYGIDVLIASTPENMRYFADYAAWNIKTYRGNTPAKGMQAYAVIPRDPSIEPAIIPMGGNYTAFVYPAQFPGWVNDFYPYAPASAWPGMIPDVPNIHNPDTPREMIWLYELTEKFRPRAVKTPGEALIKCLKEKGFEKATVAFESFGVSPGVISQLKQELPGLVLKEAGEFFRVIRAVKTENEIHRLRRAGEINEIAFRHIINMSLPGITTAELAHEHAKKLVEHGAEPTFLNIAAAEHPAVMWQPNDYVLRNGDVIWMDGGCEYEGYHSDTGLSVIIGEPNDRQKHNWEAVEVSMARAKEFCRPGEKSSLVQKTMHDTLLEYGIEIPFCMCHGVGLEERDYPLALGAYGALGVSTTPQFNDEILKGSNDLVLEPGMVICVEAIIFEWGTGGIKAEQTVLITPKGYELLWPCDRVFYTNRV